MTDSTALRKLASDLRVEADRRDAARNEKAAHVIKAAAGLGLLQLSMRRSA